MAWGWFSDYGHSHEQKRLPADELSDDVTIVRNVDSLGRVIVDSRDGEYIAVEEFDVVLLLADYFNGEISTDEFFALLPEKDRLTTHRLVERAMRGAGLSDVTCYSSNFDYKKSGNKEDKYKIGYVGIVKPREG